MTLVEDINPRLLVWARETAGLSREDAAEKLGFRTSQKETAAEKLRQVEAGERPVTARLLQRAVTTYRRPLVAFYLPAPPARGDRGHDYRTLTGISVTPREEALLDSMVRDLRARQVLLREVREDADEAMPLAFVGSADLGGDPVGVARLIRSVLGVTPERQRRAAGPAALFTLLRMAAEAIGVYVLLMGDLGTHHSDIGENVFRGVALADPVVPIVVINDNDALVARSFTLLHELAHIWIGETGVSGPVRGISGSTVERFCNAVAGAFLLPDQAWPDMQALSGASFEAAISISDDIARTWNVSQGVVTYRALVEGLLSEDVASPMFAAFAERWTSERLRPRHKDSDSGPSYYVVRRSRLGAALLDTVRRGLQADILTHTRAAKILGVSPPAVEPLLRERKRAA